MAEDKDSEKSIVQFNVVNITANPISVDLFDLATLNTTPTQPNYTNLPNTVVNTLVLPNLGKYLVLNDGSIFFIYPVPANRITIYDINNVITFGTILPFTVDDFVYDSLNNNVYLISNSTQTIRIFDCNTNTITLIIPFLNLTDVYQISIYNPINNSIYLANSNTNNIDLISCVSNTFISTIIIPTLSTASEVFVFDNIQNKLYYSNGTLPFITYIINCNSNVIIGTNSYYFTTGVFNPNNNNIYFESALNVVGVYNTITETIVTNISVPNPIGLLQSSAIYTNLNYIYFGSTGQYVQIIDATTNTFLTQINVGGTGVSFPAFNNVTQLMLFFNVNIFAQILFITPIGITTTPYYVTGATNYNYFVQNLQNEPIIVSKIRAISPQTQLDNVANILTIDSSGIQSQYPVIPLLTVSAWQEQGNISELKFKDLVFDGRTYISNYTINANTTVILEIHYEQLDNTKIRYLGQFLPKKVPLKGFFDDYVDVST